MALLDRVKERSPSSLSDPEIQRLIDEANQAIIDRYGPHPDPTQPITETIRGRVRMLDITRPIDASQPIVINEYIGTGWVVEEATLLVASDWRMWNDGRTLERLATGTNPRVRWGHRVVITYTPQNDGDQRQEVIIQLVQLALAYQGSGGGTVSSLTVGDVSTTWQGKESYGEKRECLIASLDPRNGLLMA